jgi:hypothetical protein
VLLVEWDFDLLTKLEQEEIDLPNRHSVSLLLRACDLQPNTPLVTHTVSGTYPGDSKELRWHYLNLQIPGAESSFMVEESATRLLMAIGVERAMIDRASSYLVSRIRPSYLARQHLASLLGWISHLAIENEKVRSSYQQVRHQLLLDDRSKELVEALRSIVSDNAHAVVAGVSTGGVLVAASTTQLIPGVDSVIFGQLSLAIGALVWAISRWTR